MIERFSAYCIFNARKVAFFLFTMTAILGWFALHVDVRTIFDDMLPSNHEYVQTHDKFKDSFGGSNLVTIMFEVEEGDIFQINVLQKVREVTLGLREVNAVNPYQITSLASKKVKEVKATSTGIESVPLMWPELPTTKEQMEDLKSAVLRNPLVYGSYVSKDLQATLITVDFFDSQVDYTQVFHDIQSLVNKVHPDNTGNIRVSVVGDPMLYGWVGHFFPETVELVFLGLAVTLGLLFLFLRTWRGIILPFLAGVVSAVWSLGVCQLLGINFEPLVIVVAMLITSRAVSHSVQIVNRFDDEIALLADRTDTRETAKVAARISLSELFRPGMLGVIADAGCMAVVAMSPIPLLQKLTVLAVVWILTLTVSAVILTPVLLSFIRNPYGFVHPLNCIPLLNRVLDIATRLTLSRFRFVTLGVSFLMVLVCGSYAMNLKIGDANPGSPILWPDSEYNLNAAAINSRFEGTDRMFIVVGEDGNENLLKKNSVLDAMNSFQRFIEAQPEVGGSVSLADVIPQVNVSLHEGNPHYAELGDDLNVNGMMLAILDQVSEPGDLTRYAEDKFDNGSITLMFRDRQGETIRTAVARIKEFIADNPLKEGEWKLAGGIIGVTAAVNEIILSSQIEAIALALMVLALICTMVYRSSMAGMLFMVPVIIANITTFAFMTWKGIGMNINTVPVAALGIGLGVDYAFYIADRIKEEIADGRTAEEAVATALHTAGMGVIVTASVLILATLIWWMSSLRFQAEMGLLMCIWLTISAFSALFVTPAMIYVFKPKFIFGNYREVQAEKLNKNDDNNMGQLAAS